MDDKNIWDFLYKELAKTNTVLKVYDKIFRNIEIKNNRYNQFFGLILDIFTRYICLTLAVFFDLRNDSWSLYKFPSIKKEDVDLIKTKASHFLGLRHQQFAHLSKQIIHKSNFTYLTLKGVEEVKTTIDGIRKILDQVSNLNNWKESYFLDWPDISYDFDCLIDDLKNKVKLYGEK